MFHVTREIDFCYGHRLLNYEGKCRHLHGHNGKALITLVEGMPAGVPIDQEFIDAELRRRQGGYGRGGRQKIEVDHVEFLTGVRRGRTIAAPVKPSK